MISSNWLYLKVLKMERILWTANISDLVKSNWEIIG